ncbi:hypothetical protein ACFSSF_09560 [Dietzia aerolata]|uniref:hypothetical protein n=1 Tax=Dietzia aerolata TaxID=595984 RepID=UPI00363846B3
MDQVPRALGEYRSPGRAGVATAVAHRCQVVDQRLVSSSIAGSCRSRGRCHTGGTLESIPLGNCAVQFGAGEVKLLAQSSGFLGQPR